MTSLYSLLIAITFNCNVLFGEAAQSVCSRGERLLYFTRAPSDVCVPCGKWTFMDEDNHSHTACKTCMFIEDPVVEVFVRRCNETHDTVILCKDGFYRRRARNDGEVDMCEECTRCTHPYQPCEDYNDTVCCHPSQDTVVTSSGQFVCEERPVVCGPGQFSSTSTKECLPCPDDTFMEENNHSHTTCNFCTPLEKTDLEMLISRCNKTHDSVILCKDGFYRRRAGNDRQKDRCEECTHCPHPTRACQGYQDTVCCRPNQDAVMISSGMFVCEERPVVCEPGQFFSTPTEECFPCPSWDTFMTEENHSHTACNLCTLIEDHDVEVLISLCNKTHDSVIHCKDGYYRRRVWHGGEVDSCEECTQCTHPYKACQGYSDTVCCHPNQDAVVTSSGLFVCQERRVVCGPGQLFSKSTKKCFPCPGGTFMSAHNHTYKDCLKCEQLSENNANHAIITRPCSRTAPTLFGCENGYFRDPTQKSLQTEVRCTPCQSCHRRQTNCDMFHDAVCDRKGETTTIISSASANKGEHEKAKQEINMKKDSETWTDVENTSQANTNNSELPKTTESLEMREVRIFFEQFLIVLFLSNVLLLLWSFFKTQNNSKATRDNKRRPFLRFIQVDRIKRFTLVGALSALSIFLHVGFLVIFSITKSTKKLKLASLSAAIILQILIIICFIIIYKTNRKPQQDDLRIRQTRGDVSVDEEEQLDTAN